MDFENQQISINQIPSFQEVEYTGLKVGYKWIRMIWSTIFYGILIIVTFSTVLATARISNSLADVIVISLGVLWILNIIRIHITFPYLGYALRQRDILFKRGWLFRSKTVVPFNRVQHCEVTQGPLGSIFDVSRLKIYTAGGNQSDLTIPGISKVRANELKQFIIERTVDEEE